MLTELRSDVLRLKLEHLHALSFAIAGSAAKRAGRSRLDHEVMLTKGTGIRTAPVGRRSERHTWSLVLSTSTYLLKYVRTDFQG